MADFGQALQDLDEAQGGQERAPGGFDQALQDLDIASKSPQVAPQPPSQEVEQVGGLNAFTRAPGELEAFTRSAVRNLPIVGRPLARGLEDFEKATRQLFGQSAQEIERQFALRDAERTEQFGASETVGAVAGNVAGTAAIVSAAPAVFGIGGPVTLASSLASGASFGALAGADKFVRDLDEGKSVEEAKQGALFTGAVSGVMALFTPIIAERVGGAIGSQLSRALGLTENPTLASTALRAEKQALNAAAHAQGVQVTANSVRRLRFRLESTLRREFYEPDQHGTIRTALGVVDRVLDDAAGAPIPLAGLERIRRAFNNARFTSNGQPVADGNIYRLAGFARDVLDDFVERLPQLPNALAGGNPQAANAFLRQFRDVYNRQRSTEHLEDIMLAAASTQNRGGVGEGVLQGFRTLARNRRRMARFTPEEQEAIRAFAESRTPQQLFDFLMDFDRTGVIKSLLLFAGGTSAGGPVVGTVAAVGGQLSQAARRGVASENTVRQAEQIIQGIASGEIRRQGGLVNRQLTVGEIFRRGATRGAITQGTARGLESIRERR